MRASTFIPLFGCFTTALAAADPAPWPMHRMIRKRMPSPLLPELHLTSEDPKGSDALSPVTDTFGSSNTFSDYFQKGGLTGAGSPMESLAMTGPNSLLDADKLNAVPGDSGVDLSGIGNTASVTSLGGGALSPSTGSGILSPTSGGTLSSLTDGGLLNGLGRRDTLAAVSSIKATAMGKIGSLSDSAMGASSMADVGGMTGDLLGRLRGMKVKRLPISLLSSSNTDEVTPLSSISTVLDTTLGNSLPDGYSGYSAFGSPYLASRSKSRGSLSLLDPEN